MILIPILTSTSPPPTSALLNFFTQYQTRFRQMTLLLKYWAKQNGLINTESFSSYSFTLLIIFYLQCGCNPWVLPSIERLQALARTGRKRKPEIKIHRYNFEFCDNRYKIDQSKNTDSVARLIVGFFR